METSELQAISQTILRLATPDMKPKKLFKAVRDAHPDASRKEIMRAAFLAVIARSDIDPEGAKQLHDVVMDERGGDARTQVRWGQCPSPAHAPAAEPPPRASRLLLTKKAARANPSDDKVPDCRLPSTATVRGCAGG